MTDPLVERLQVLVAENDELRVRVVQLTEEIAFLRMHAALAQGMKGETLVGTLTGGTPAADYCASFDLNVRGQVKVEVKFSKLNVPVPGQATRLMSSSWCRGSMSCRS